MTHDRKTTKHKLNKIFQIVAKITKRPERASGSLQVFWPPKLNVTYSGGNFKYK